MQLCSELPDEERILFLKRYFEGYDSTQLSAMYGIPCFHRPIQVFKRPAQTAPEIPGTEVIMENFDLKEMIEKQND